MGSHQHQVASVTYSRAKKWRIKKIVANFFVTVVKQDCFRRNLTKESLSFFKLFCGGNFTYEAGAA